MYVFLFSINNEKRFAQKKKTVMTLPVFRLVGEGHSLVVIVESPKTRLLSSTVTPISDKNRQEF